MDENEVTAAGASQLADLLHSEGIGQSWSPSDYSAMWQHQLSCQLQAIGQHINPKLSDELQAALSDTSDQKMTIGQLLHEAGSSVALLDLVKRVAKTMRNDPEGGLPPDITTALYFSLIAATLVQHGTLISSLTNEHVREGLEWSSRRSWIDEKTRLLLDEAGRKSPSKAGHGPEDIEGDQQ